jgi:hypothetical protein
MPYIKKELRKKIDTEIIRLHNKIVGLIMSEVERGDSVLTDIQLPPGIYNYVITRLLTDYYCPNLSYFNINTMIGILECCKQEMYRRLSCYENKAIEKNGDVEEYKIVEGANPIFCKM